MNFDLPTLPSDFYFAITPTLVLCVGAMIALMQSVFPKVLNETKIFGIVIGSLVVGLAFAMGPANGQEQSFIGGSYLAGGLTQYGQGLLLAVAAIVCVLMRETHLRQQFFRGEIVALYLMVIAGMMVLVGSEDLITVFVGLELSSIGLYAIIGYINPTQRSQEGAVKYFILGAFAAGILLFGFGLLYAATGSLQISEIVAAIPKAASNRWLQVGGLLTAIGLGFKLALVPFHLWAPDAYEAAPTGITALMATNVKIMILIVTTRIFVGMFDNLFEVWMPAMMFMAMLSMIIGNIMALVQPNLKRMLAYSSIAHSGYMAIAICAIGNATRQLPVASILFYVTSYAIISMGTFAILMWLEHKDNENLNLEDISGLNQRHPWAAGALATFMFAFAGLPPTVGFIAKFFVFNAALKGQLYMLVIIGVIGSTISLYYYLRVIVRMYMSGIEESNGYKEPKPSLAFGSTIGAAVALTILLGTIFPGKFIETILEKTEEVASR